MGMKDLMKRHEENLRNQEISLRGTGEELDRLISKYARDKQEYNFYALQIEEAKKLKKDGFDREKFMRHRGKNHD